MREKNRCSSIHHISLRTEGSLNVSFNPLTPIAVAFETTPSNYNMLVYFFCTLFQFVCCIKCNAGGAPPAGIAFYADKLKKRAEKVNKHIII